MCVAIVKPSGAELPTRDILKICFKNNPDGAGFAYNRNGKNYIHKGYFTFAEFYNALEKCHIKDSESALIHFRVATHGNIDRQTCHPFLITGCLDDMKLTHIKTTGNVMIHNGMLSFFIKDETISDSMILAKNLYKLDLSKEENRTFIELALRNNNKLKMNRLAILYANNKTDLFGFKEPWEIVNGCFFSNKSYEKTFSRVYKSIQNNEDKFDYDENEIQSKKIAFCKNRKNGCDNFGIYAINYDEDKYDLYCENCIKDISYFNCKICEKSFYLNNESDHDDICQYCYKENKLFIEQQKCYCGKLSTRKINIDESNVFFSCNDCHKNTFSCSECGKMFLKEKESKIKNLCVYCIDKNKSTECLYCKSKNNLIRTNFSTICEKCFEEKHAETCYLCNKNFIYGGNKINNLSFCSKCFTSTFGIEKIMEYFQSFKMLNKQSKDKLIKMLKESNQEKQQQVIELYKNNNNFLMVKTNYVKSLRILNLNVKEIVK